jgi:hypothetical protein
MNSQEKHRDELSRGLSKAQPFLRLLERILEVRDEPSQKREQLVKYCRSRGLEESNMWDKLALYKQSGPVDVLFTIEQVSHFAEKQQRFRQRIVELIGSLPHASLEDFRALLDFRRFFLERLEYVSDLLVYFFLEREKGLWRESQDSSVYTNYFNHKLFREFTAINEIADGSAGIEKLRNRYESWLLDQALDEEAPV